jgi:hypothetical protein
MKYTLTTALGRKYSFYSFALAEIYQGAYGGTILVLDEQLELELE